jgi:hypothetical protein
MLLDATGSLAIGAIIATMLVVVVTAVPLANATRIAIAALAGAWVAFAAIVTAAGWLARPLTLPAVFAVPFIVAIVLSRAFPSFRAALAKLPPSTIIRLYAMRAIVGGFFLILAVAQRLDGPFPYSAGIGDFITGIAAFSIARVAVDRGASDWRVIAWNVFGTLDLLVAVVLGVASRLTASHVTPAGATLSAIGMLPWSLVPLVLVPILLIGHALVFAQMRRPAESRQGYASSVT